MIEQSSNHTTPAGAPGTAASEIAALRAQEGEQRRNSAADLFAGPGEVRALCRAFDWSATPLGPVERWPQSLCTVAALILACPVGMILLWGPELVQLYNDAYVKVMGVKHPAGLGQRNRECWPEAQAFSVPLYEGVLARGESYTFTDQRLVLERNGVPEETFFTLSYSGVRDDDGTVTGILVMVTETTAEVRRRLAEAEATNAQLQDQAIELELTNQQLQEQAIELEAQAEELQATAEELADRTAAAEAAERRLQLVFAQAPAIVAVTEGPEHRYVLANQRAELVANRGRLVGRTYREVFPELEAQGFADILDRVYHSGEPFVASEVPVALDRGDAGREEGWYSFVYQPLADAGGRVTGIMQHAVDVTAQVRARLAMAASEAQLRTLADAIPTLAWTARADGYIDWYNARWYEYTGTTPEQMAGWGWQAVHDPAVLPEVMARWQASIASGEAFEMTFPLRGSDGHFRTFLTRVSPVTGPDGRVLRWFGTNTDVEAEHRAREAAEHANQAKTEFLATMSHELRTPLNAIAGYAELLEIGIHGPVTDPQREAIRRIQRSQRHLLGLINDILNFAKLEAGRVEYRIADVSVRAVIDELELLVAPQMRAKALRFARDECADGRVVRADPEKLQQILVNLFSNAIKFTAAGGAITLRCETAGDRVLIAVEDTGMGIPPDRLEQVFAPFVQVDRRLNAPHEGTGLGLAISRELARGMGGDVTAQSTVGAGSTFTLTLPRA